MYTFAELIEKEFR